jgi:hypothetical protein
VPDCDLHCLHCATGDPNRMKHVWWHFYLFRNVRDGEAKNHAAMALSCADPLCMKQAEQELERYREPGNFIQQVRHQCNYQP